ncbi:MAG: hypothetical protein A2Y00_05805 [Omnitrophica WOR_2 bacterium GWF2_43_52]|nr:MAG: hypothetical protein A2062_04565 [Omnitrophica WOR_2 bacterium GWA2_44_7]OGX16518.1 MAG: hypothetical protein A2Y01_00230 [Omnitrophica WOR_2 bacterium GWC2_44_8]OGX20613.1 MAG: hypothetical protein A2Y00_05805 [Omnitrophica WOR_2 bacterium GWF2_43_52]OGX59042.1 MAG: hypothetical protein A2460_01560 [Omnitrophica WOR_2 bacterium RIFOXYC2_FULL_43_9]HAH21567.1 hypothetical protein [Candidatus Omnitrophota bacterium]
MKRQNNKYKGLRGQGMLEHVVFLCLVIGALLLLGYYVKNSLSGKFRDGADVFGQGDVYRPLGETVVSISETINIDY